MSHAIARFPELSTPKSYTTRARRADAVETPHYAFVSVEEFKEKVANGEFLEWAEFSGNYYGTPREDIEQGLREGKVMFKEMEVQGVRRTRELLPKEELITVFIDAGSWEELSRRALLRGPMEPEVLERRRLRYEDELTFMPEADVIIENHPGRQEEAMAAFEAVIAKAIEDAHH